MRRLQKVPSCSCMTSKILLSDSFHADGHGLSRLAGRRRHELRADRIANTLAENAIDRREITFCRRQAAYLIDWRELLRTTRAPECDADARLLEQPESAQLNHALAK